MKVSVVIVSYNVRFFLEECLYSVQRAMQNIEAEVWVVDNCSVDNSVRMIKEQFPWVRLIENQSNDGFAKANNKAIELSVGEYVLLLNPDTVIPEDFFRQLLSFADTVPNAGAIGVKMLNGRGEYLPESKRGIPTPFVSFCKMSGLTKIFPYSPLFARYYLGHLDNNHIHQVEILSGACMLLRRSVLQQIGVLDEAFFMYGEDVDLSYRVLQAGYLNYYYPHTTIIHYKGKSTQKASFNYVRHFYMAMIIFTRKHLKSQVLLLFLQIAIALRAAIGVLSRTVRNLIWSLVDFIVLLSAFIGVAHFWAWYKFGEQTFRREYFMILAPVYSVLIVLGILLFGGYRRYATLSNVLKGFSAGLLAIIAVYAFSPEWLRFSRITLLLASLLGVVVIALFRKMNHLVLSRNPLRRSHGIAIVGIQDECSFLRNKLINHTIGNHFVGLIHPNTENLTGYIGSFAQIPQLVTIHQIDELLFCSEQLSHQAIISCIAHCGSRPVTFTVLPPADLLHVKSYDDDICTWLYPIHSNTHYLSRRFQQKRIFDISLSIILLLVMPLWLFIPRFWPISLSFKALFAVFAGRRTWVGYLGTPHNLPRYQKPIIQISKNELQLFHYTQNYSFLKDIYILFQYLFKRNWLK